MRNTISEIFNILADGNLSEVLPTLVRILTLSNSDLLNDSLLLSARFKKLESDKRKGIIDWSSESIEFNKIMDSTISLVKELKNQPEILQGFKEIDITLNKATKERNLILPFKVKEALYDRLAHTKTKNVDFSILWIDDNPNNNCYEIMILNAINIRPDIAITSEVALEKLKSKKYDLIISDIQRENNVNEGLEFHRQLINLKFFMPLIFYTGQVDKNKGVPPFAFGIADLPSDLLHLIIDVIQRK